MHTAHTERVIFYVMNKKQEVGLRLKHLRNSHGISQRALADKCGWGASRIGNYEAGVRSVNLEDAEILAKNLEIQPFQILFDEAEIARQINIHRIDVQPRYTQGFPVLSSVQAGAWTEADEPCLKGDMGECYKTTERTSDKCFWLKVQGDSMTSPAGISFPEETLVLVDTEREPLNGSLVVAKLTEVNEATFKKLVIDAGQQFLKPLNSAYPPLLINDDCKIIGVIVDAKMKLF